MTAPSSSQDAQRALTDAAAHWSRLYGTGSRLELCAAYAREIDRACKAGGEAFAQLCARVEREHQAKYGLRRLTAEADDERERDAAVEGDAALIAYDRKWARRLAKLQRAHPSRWRLPGLSDEELRDALTLRLIDAVRTRSEELSKHHRPGKEWGLLFLARQRRIMRSSFRLQVVLTDPSPVFDRTLDEEERLIADQTLSAMALARQRAEARLTRPQRRWLAAMKMMANAGAFFESSGRLNLSAVSRMLDKNRSSAQRAFEELQHRFVRELQRLER
jgi:hypothetical protein